MKPMVSSRLSLLAFGLSGLLSLTTTPVYAIPVGGVRLNSDPAGAATYDYSWSGHFPGQGDV